MKEFLNEIDIKAFLVYIIVLIGLWFNKIDLIVAILFILSTFTLKIHLRARGDQK